MDDEISPAEAFNAWHDTTLAAELAERLARSASETILGAARAADDAEAIADLAEHAAASADLVASTARAAATRARQLADDLRADDGRDREAVQPTDGHDRDGPA